MKSVIRVSYLEQTTPVPQPAHASCIEHIGIERLSREDYLDLYRRVGEPQRWDQRTTMPVTDLTAWLDGDSLRLYVLRDRDGAALGFCEFDRSGFPHIELKNFGLVAKAQGRGLGWWLLSTALHGEWRSKPSRIWLHTDVWDHPAALPLYRRIGFAVFDVRDEPATSL